MNSPIPNVGCVRFLQGQCPSEIGIVKKGVMPNRQKVTAMARVIGKLKAVFQRIRDLFNHFLGVHGKEFKRLEQGLETIKERVTHLKDEPNERMAARDAVLIATDLDLLVSKLGMLQKKAFGNVAKKAEQLKKRDLSQELHTIESTINKAFAAQQQATQEAVANPSLALTSRRQKAGCSDHVSVSSLSVKAITKERFEEIVQQSKINIEEALKGDFRWKLEELTRHLAQNLGENRFHKLDWNALKDIRELLPDLVYTELLKAIKFISMIVTQVMVDHNFLVLTESGQNLDFNLDICNEALVKSWGEFIELESAFETRLLKVDQVNKQTRSAKNEFKLMRERVKADVAQIINQIPELDKLLGRDLFFDYCTSDALHVKELSAKLCQEDLSDQKFVSVFNELAGLLEKGLAKLKERDLVTEVNKWFNLSKTLSDLQKELKEKFQLLEEAKALPYKIVRDVIECEKVVSKERKNAGEAMELARVLAENRPYLSGIRATATDMSELEVLPMKCHSLMV